SSHVRGRRIGLSRRIAAPTSASIPTVSATGPGSGPTSASRPGPRDPLDAAAMTAATAPEHPAMPTAIATRGAKPSSPSLSDAQSSAYARRAIHPASAPSAIGTSATSSSHPDPLSGTIPNRGTPGTTPSDVPDGETAVPEPIAKPGPAIHAIPHAITVG